MTVVAVISLEVAGVVIGGLCGREEAGGSAARGMCGTFNALAVVTVNVVVGLLELVGATMRALGEVALRGGLAVGKVHETLDASAATVVEQLDGLFKAVGVAMSAPSEITGGGGGLNVEEEFIVPSRRIGAVVIAEVAIELFEVVEALASELCRIAKE